ncbi:MAG: BatA domain-containing protein, partial [Lentisphaerae bacterium]|nr:BatA domain-containing protein [Lentisphaerota bacterium]
MTFVHTGFLVALVLGIIPILIYYLIRFRSLRLDWGASYVLQRALERMKKKVYLEQLILLVLRVLAVMLIVVVFARPVSRKRTHAVVGTGTHRMIVLDASYSMLAGETQATSWDRALAATRELVGSWGRGERWSLYLIGRQPRWAVDDEAVVSPEQSQAVIDALEPAETSASLAQSLNTVLKKVEGRPTEVYIVADAQAATWRGVDQITIAPTANVRFFWIHPPSPGDQNLAVTRLQLSHDRILVRHPCRALVTVRNYGTEPVENAELEILVDGAFSSREQVSLLPGQETIVGTDVVFDEAGSHAVTARLRKDVLDFDNAASAGVDVTSALSAFVLRDPDRTHKFASSWAFLDLAAKVMSRKDEDDAPLFVGGLLSIRLLETIDEPDALAGADIVVLDGGCTLTPERVQALGAHVKRGGGLILAADDTIDLKTWNDQLGPAGLLPARLVAIRREALGGDRFRTLGRTGLDHPALKSLETTDDGDIAVSRLYSWTDLADPVDGARVLARFADGQPFAVERLSGPGSVILLATGLNSRNNNLIVREFTFPLLLNLFCQAASGSLYPRTVPCGAPIRLRLKDGDPPVSIQFGIEGQPPVVLPPQEIGGSSVVALAEGADRSGLGSVLLTWKDRHERVWFGVQGDRVDSDLRPMDADARKRIDQRLAVEEAASWPELKA